MSSDDREAQDVKGMADVLRKFWPESGGQSSHVEAMRAQEVVADALSAAGYGLRAAAAENARADERERIALAIEALHRPVQQCDKPECTLTHCAYDGGVYPCQTARIARGGEST